MAALQERKQALEALLSSRVGELKQVCLQEAVSPAHGLTACSFTRQHLLLSVVIATCWPVQALPITPLLQFLT